MQIVYSRDALKFLKKQDAKTVARIRKAIDGLTQNPPVGDIKPLEGSKSGRMRLRVGGFRVIYQYGADHSVTILFVIDIGSRGDIYK